MYVECLLVESNKITKSSAYKKILMIFSLTLPSDSLKTVHEILENKKRYAYLVV